MKNALNIFKQVTGYDIQAYFESFILFCNSYYPLIVSYYLGEETETEDAFGRLDTLLSQTKEIEPLFNLKANSLQRIDCWELLDYFTECQTKLWTINNSSRWMRSSVIGRYGANISVDRVLKTRETFEDVATSLGSSTSQNSWVDIAKDNLVEEENYDANNGGDSMFKINLKQSGNFDIQNIVDNLDTEKILGKDIDADFRIENGDIPTVNYDLAIRQSLNTIQHSLKGSIPEFPEYGLPNDIVGSSANAIQYPTIFKHLINMFQRDGRWEAVNLIDLYKKDDNLFLKIEAKTVTNNFLTTNIQI